MKNFKKLQLALSGLVLVIANLAAIPLANAGSLTQSIVAESNMTTSGSSAVAVSFKTSAGGGGTAVSLSFTGWTGGGAGAVAASQTVTNGCALFSGMAGANLPGTPAASGNAATGVITFSGVTTLAASTVYCVTLTGSAVTNPTASTVTSVAITAGNDSSTASIDSMTPGSISISATVAPSFTMSLDSSSEALGTLSTSTYSVTPTVTATVATNAANGWYVWAKDANAGLASTNASKTIATVATGSNASLTCSGACTEKYALGVTSANATANYADAGGNTGGGLSTSTLYPIASGGTATAGAAVTMKALASAAPNTPPATDYADTITVVGAGSF